jgi:hypothetical protein
MSPTRSTPPAHVPVLTDVIEMPASSAAPRHEAPAPPAAQPHPVLDEAQLVANLMTELQHRVDAMLEHRLRESLAPLLAKAADDMVAAAKADLAATLRDVLSRAVTQELARHRNRH